MDSCVACGHELGIGRFCTNCGHPVGPRDAWASWRTDTAERPRVAAPVADEPQAPLFVDEVAPAPPPPPRTLPPARTGTQEPVPPRHRSRWPRAWLPWPVGLLALALLAVLAVWLLSGDDDAPTATEPRERRSASSGPSEPSASLPVEPTTPTDLARFTQVSAPPPAPASRDTSGDVVRYVGTNLVDGSPTTCWRMPGDGTGESITFRFEAPVRLTEVGLVNGYAKRSAGPSGEVDWYAGNRRIRSVEWTFDDGTMVTQELVDTTDMQTVPLDDVETESVTVRLLAVTPPGAGPASRDYTAISDVRLLGAALT